MDYTKFQVALVELADGGARLTTANVVARLRIDPAEAERHLDRMSKEGRLDLEVDEDEGVVVYSVRGLSPRREASSHPGGPLRSLEEAAFGHLLTKQVGVALGLKSPRGGAPLPASLQRSVARGVVLGGVLPGLGLAYTAPWPIVAVATLAVVVGFKILAWVSLFFALPFLFAAAVASAVLGGLYTWQYNQMGRRAALGDDPSGERKLPLRMRF